MLAASENPTAIAVIAPAYAAKGRNPPIVGARQAAARNTTITTEKTANVITAFEIDVMTRIHDGTRALVRRYPLVCSEMRPLLVPSVKKSQRNSPTIKSSLYVGFEANRNEKTPISTTNMLIGFSRAHTNHPSVP